MRILPLLLLAFLAFIPCASADDGLHFFEKEIRPVLVEHCYECHSAQSKIVKGGLLLDTRDGIRKGGDSGPSVVPGKPEESLILGALRHETFEMPPEKKLPAAVVASFEKWIAAGAPDPREGGTASAARTIDLAAGRQFWAYRPVPTVEIPPALPGERSDSPIDRFVAHGWKEQQLVPAEPADRRTLIRRATFDVTGLPPTVEEIAEFLADRSSDEAAFARVVDRLLASPHYGERWGRHWLDLARFSESTGGGRSMLIAEAWRYRDYVVKAYNTDKPFSQFVVEQIAGDLLPYSSLEQGADQFTATSFLALGPTNYEEQDKTQLEMDVIDEQIDTLGKVFLGQTIGCARCHDHKFDPIPTADYYAMAGIFRSTRTLIHDNVSKWMTHPLPVPPDVAEKLARFDNERKTIEKDLASAEKSLRTLKQKVPALLLDESQAKFTGPWQLLGTADSEPGYRIATADRDGKAKAVYEVGRAVLESGPYEIRLGYVADRQQAKSVRVRIEHATGVKVVKVDQSAEPVLDGRFTSLGEFSLSPESSHSVTITAANDGNTIVGPLVLVPRFALSTSTQATGGIVPIASLPGIVIDDEDAVKTGEWTQSTSVKSYVGEGYSHDANSSKGEKRVTFSADLPKSGDYEVRIAFHAAPSRAKKVTVRVTHPAGEAVIYLDQTKAPPIDGLFQSLGRYRFANDQTAVVTISNEETSGVVIADAVQFLPIDATPAGSDPTVASAAPMAPPVPKDLSSAVERMIGLQATMKRMNANLTELKKNAPPEPPKVPSVADEDATTDMAICIRGNYKHRGAIVPRGYLQVASVDDAARPKLQTGESGRLALARWIASPDNPLTARVYVNRVWQHLIGAGLVRTVDNFGVTGETPSHPQLLDYLARRFTDDGWSARKLIREIMLSRVYRLGSGPVPPAGDRDPENRFLSHANRKRLDAGEIYDSILVLSGSLNRAVGGETIRSGTKEEYGYQFEVGRRALYLPVFRNRLPEVFGVFDFADPNTPVGRRNVTTLPTQALFLMNNPLVTNQSRLAAERLLKRDEPDSRRLDRLCEEAYGRLPTDVERAAFRAYLGDPQPTDDGERLSRWSALVQTLIASIDFRYVD